MISKRAMWYSVFLSLVLFAGLVDGCNQNNSTSSASGTSNSNSSSCTETENTSDSTTVTNGCYLLSRNESTCQTSRSNQGLSGAWLLFSCAVTETAVTISGTSYVQLRTSDLPDYKSNYFSSTSPCYAAYTTSYPDPNTIASHGVTLNIPTSPSSNAVSTMALGPVGLAIDGVAIYDNSAAGGVGGTIWDEVGSFDECQGHPDNSSMYHYHTEPYSISYNDDNLIGVMRDGYFIYGRNDMNGSPATGLDSNGGHVGVTPYSNGVPVYHYHLTQQHGTNTAGSAVTAWFMTTGTYYGVPGPASW